MCYLDLEPYQYVDNSPCKAIGWLERDKPFPRGAVPLRILLKLYELTENLWEHVHFAGFECCPFCPPKGRVRPSGNGVVLVPGEADLFAAPQLVGHYIEVHKYCPPASFLKAVEHCPPMSSVAYFRKLMPYGVWGYEFWVIEYADLQRGLYAEACRRFGALPLEGQGKKAIEHDGACWLLESVDGVTTFEDEARGRLVRVASSPPVAMRTAELHAYLRLRGEESGFDPPRSANGPYSEELKARSVRIMVEEMLWKGSLRRMGDDAYALNE